MNNNLGNDAWRSTFVYIEFEALSGAGHRLHTANHYAKKLRELDCFGQFHIVAPAPKESVAPIVSESLSAYDSQRLTLCQLSAPNESQLNIVDVARQLVTIVADLQREHGGKVLLYAHMPSPFALLALYCAARLLAESAAMPPTLLVRLCMIDEEWTWYQVRLSSLIRLCTRDPLTASCFHFTTESSRLTQYYKERSGVFAPIQFNPFPRSDIVATRDKHGIHHRLYGDSITFAFLGEAREEKGFETLPALVQSIIASGIDFQFIVHCFSNPVNDTPPIRNARRQLLDLRAVVGLDKLVLIPSPVPESIYAAHQQRADVVVMPYRASSYRIRGSGVAFEAIRSNAFILCTADTDIAATYSHANLVIEYDPHFLESEDVARVVNSVFRSRKQPSRIHPADLFRDQFYEVVVREIVSGMRRHTSLTSGEDPSDTAPLIVWKAVESRSDVDTLASLLSPDGAKLLS